MLLTTAANAPIKMLEYSDYQCPFCERFFSGAFPGIKSEYIKTGQVYFVYKDLPLSFHPNAMPAAQAAHCAGEQGKYYQMHDLLFTFHEDWVDQRDVSLVFNKFADVLNLKGRDFKTCYESKKYVSQIQKSLQLAKTDGASGTPYFLINGTPFPGGAVPFQYFQEAFASILSPVDKKVPSKK